MVRNIPLTKYNHFYSVPEGLKKEKSLLNNLIREKLTEVKMATQGYCVKCKAKVDIKNPVESTTAKGTKIAKGKCPDCGTTVCRMGGIKK